MRLLISKHRIVDYSGSPLLCSLLHPTTRVDTMADSSQLTQGGSKVRQSCQSTIVGGACAELLILTGISEQPDLRKGILGILKNHWVDFYHYRTDVYTHFKHTFMFKQHLKWFLHPMTPLNCVKAWYFSSKLWDFLSLKTLASWEQFLQRQAQLTFSLIINIITDSGLHMILMYLIISVPF